MAKRHRRVTQATLEIADHLGIRHPRDPSTKSPIVMTTDFVVTVRRGIQWTDQARTVKLGWPY